MAIRASRGPADLTRDELLEILDTRARQYLGISGEEFMERLKRMTCPIAQL
jgi:hypothetical protein